MKYPYRITQKTSGYAIVQHVQEVRLNVPVDQQLFKAPSFKVQIR
jgi:hypothetical protein